MEDVLLGYLSKKLDEERARRIFFPTGLPVRGCVGYSIKSIRRCRCLECGAFPRVSRPQERLPHMRRLR
eukprot:g11065.t1